MLSFLAVSCSETPDFLGDNSETIGVTPNIYMNPLSAPANEAEGYQSGEVVSTSLEFFSTTDIQEIRVYSKIGDGERQLETTIPYTPAFSQLKSQDTLVISYTIPELQESARITIFAEIVNVNTLTDEASQSLDLILACPPGSIAGTYLATTSATTPFDGEYDNTGTPYEVTITDLGNNEYLISDITGGLYGEFYPAAYPSIDVMELPADLTRDKCQVFAVDVPDDPAFEAAFGPNLLQASGVIGVSVSGDLTIDFFNSAGDSGSSKLIRQ
jgi:hypothetical protein